MDMGLLAINKLDESSTLSTPSMRIRYPLDGSHWSLLDHVLGEATTLVMSAWKSDHDYNYKTEFQIWKENKEFERQNISMIWPPLDSTHVGTNTSNAKISHLDLTPVGTKNPYPQATNTTNGIVKTEKKGREHIPEDLESDPSPSDSSMSESDSSNDRNFSKSRSNNEYDSADDSKCRKPKIKKRNTKKSVGNTMDRTC